MINPAINSKTYFAIVDPEHVPSYWPTLQPLFKKSFDRFTGWNDFSDEELLDGCVNRRNQCWVMHDGNTVLGSLITRLSGDRIEVLIIGTVDGYLDEWVRHFEEVKEFGRFNGAHKAMLKGRPGWVKKLFPSRVRIEAEFDL